MNTHCVLHISRTARLIAAIAIILVTMGRADASILCVNPGATNGCLGTIGAAVAAAASGDTIQVAKGTYNEIVVLSRSVSLSGANQKNTIIDATGLSMLVGPSSFPIANGIFIDGLDNPGLSNVLIGGFTIQNANFEGILIANASSVTIANNTVTGNDKSLAGGMCPGIATFETNEQFDCGEGIHLIGADRVTVSNNVVESNGGGILLSDDTAMVHDNLIVGNTVKDNPFDCGITLASHAPAALTGSSVPLGVLRNTISGNTSTSNGLGLLGEGAGVGIFDSPVANATNSNNVVINNTLTNNGLPGVAMHAHLAGQDMSNNQIVGNTISGNGADTMNGAATTTGINVFGASPLTGTVIVGNTIKKESVDVLVNSSANADVHLNDLKGKGVGVQNLSTGTTDASSNWWGCAKGPGAKACSGATGSTGTLLTTPFATKAF
jgi:parallel beta-helix repeat protein